jgi:DNA-binding NarL/FixJ family response regulator
MEKVSRPIRILVVDDHPMMRDGIASAIKPQKDMVLVGQASNGHEAIIRFREVRPDVILMDLKMPEMNGIDAMLAIRREAPDARFIVLTTYKGDAQAIAALKAGAMAYLLKSMLRKELLETIRAAYAGQRRIPPEIALEIAQHALDDALTQREIDVLRRVGRGAANKKIANELGVTEDTVKAHMKNVFAKLGAQDRTHAVTIALKRGIIEL